MSDASSSKDDSQLTLTGMGTQLGINVAIAVVVLCAFNFLRPNNSRKQLSLQQQTYKQ